MIKRLFKRYDNSINRSDSFLGKKANVNLEPLRFKSGEAVSVHIDFKCSRLDTGKKWVDIVSLRRKDSEAAFVFRVNQLDGLLQLYFGDGKQVRGRVTFDALEFFGVEATLTYVRSQDITYASLETEGRKEVHFGAHNGKIAAVVPPHAYREGNAESGIALRRVEFSRLPSGSVSLDTAEEFMADTSVQRSAGYYRSLNALGVEYFKAKEYEKALDIFVNISSASSSNIDNVAFLRARSCINSLYESSGRKDCWARFSSPEDALFGQARKALSDGDTEASLSMFSNAVREVLGGPSYQISEGRLELFVNAFKVLVSKEGDDTAVMPSFKPARIAIVSGMGWSGSGAVYDYLKEFDDIVAIKGETPYIEGSQSLRKIYSVLLSDKKLKERIFDFFFYTLIGHCYYKDAGDFKLFKLARGKLLSDKYDQYVEAVQGWCVLARSLCAAQGEERFRLFQTLSDYTVTKFSVGLDIPEGQIALLDNVVHIQHSSECINFLNNATIFCTFRDPRSNYVALLREAGHYNSSVAAYIEERKDRIPRLLQTYQSARKAANESSGKAVEMVRFEQFVLSESYRQELAGQLGLDLGKQTKHRYFKPWESMRNIILHQEHPNQDEIKLIEKELGEYCYEPCIRPLQEEMSSSNTGEQCVI